MQILNIHTRTIPATKSQVVELFESLATENDKVWVTDKWPRMKFKNGLKEGSSGGHGPIRYSVSKLIPGERIEFRFSKPKGFNGIHKFEIEERSNQETHITHTIDMSTSGLGTLKWLLAIRWLHDALIEDTFDKVESQFCKTDKTTEWNVWVKFLRFVLK